MAPTLFARFVIRMALLVAAVGVLDSAAERQWDLTAVFAVLICLHAVLLWRVQSRRPDVPIRGDLVAWLRERSAATGEPMELIADRCIARARADFSQR